MILDWRKVVEMYFVYYGCRLERECSMWWIIKNRFVRINFKYNGIKLFFIFGMLFNISIVIL